MITARISRLDYVSDLRDSGARVDAEGGIYGTALHAAVVGGHSEVVKYLHENGASAILWMVPLALHSKQPRFMVT
jgi:ankyrin repeat protein